MKTKCMIFVLTISFIFFFTFCAFALEEMKVDPTLIHFDPKGGSLIIITCNSGINEISFEMTLQSGWNLISVPLDTTRLLVVSDLFPDALELYDYKKESDYVSVAKDQYLNETKGYWILVNSTKTYILEGFPLFSYSYPIQDGWHMLGGCASTAKIFCDNCNIAVIYKYEPGFGYKRILEGENLDAGKGYWILIKDAKGQSRLDVQSIMD